MDSKKLLSSNGFDIKDDQCLSADSWNKISREIAQRLTAIADIGIGIDFSNVNPIEDGYFVGPCSWNMIDRSLLDVPRMIAAQTGRPIQDVVDKIIEEVFEPAIIVLDRYIRLFSHQLAYSIYVDTLNGHQQRQKQYTTSAAIGFKLLLEECVEELIFLTYEESVVLFREW